MNCCNKKCISIIMLIIAVVIFIQTNFLTIMLLNLKNNSLEISSNKSGQKDNFENEKQVSSINTKENWKIVIPKINVSSIIKDGTSGDIINNYVGHFSETPKENGNIGLIAASAGYKENYFENLKKLSQGDVIVYINNNIKREYKVITNEIIEETDWSYLSNTKDNRITLITGILEEPKHRRCVQAVEISYV